MNVFVAGGTGVLGRATLRSLGEAGHQSGRPHAVRRMPGWSAASVQSRWTLTSNVEDRQWQTVSR